MDVEESKSETNTPSVDKEIDKGEIKLPTVTEEQHDPPNSAEVTIKGHDANRLHEMISADGLVGAIKSSNPRRYIRECLGVLFDNDSIRAFCYDYFNDVYKELQGPDRRKHIITLVMDYCELNRKTEYLWQCIKDTHPQHFGNYYPRWKELQESQPTIEQVDTNAYTFTKQENVEAKDTQDILTSPLDKKSDQLEKWFFGDLNVDEQSLLLTVAIFQNMSRYKLVGISSDLKEILSKHLLP